jgi:hypothetical protein
MTHDDAVRNVRELAAQLDSRTHGAVATPAQLRYVADMADSARELSRQGIGMLEKIGSLIEDRDKLIEAGEALHQRVMRADARIVALEAERDREDRLLLADWHHSVKDGMHVWRTVLNLGVPGHWSDGSTLIEVSDADRATAARLAEEKLDAPPPA